MFGSSAEEKPQMATNSESVLPILDGPHSLLVRPVVSVHDLASRLDEPVLRCHSEIYEVRRWPALPIDVSESCWPEIFKLLKTPREEVSKQEVVTVRNRFFNTATAYNYLAYQTPRVDAGYAARSPIPFACSWCHGSRLRNLVGSTEPFPVGDAQQGSVRAGPDLVRQAPISGRVVGDATMHDFFSMAAAEFEALFTVAEEYTRRSLSLVPGALFAWEVVANIAAREHASVHVLGQQGQHFAFPEMVARIAPADYWQRALTVHRSLGLAIDQHPTAAWVSLAPAGHTEVFIHSLTVSEGACFVHKLLGILGPRTSGCQLTVFPSPKYFDPVGDAGHFSEWPPILWRLILSDPCQPYCLTSPCGSLASTDPFLVVEWLKENITW